MIDIALNTQINTPFNLINMNSIYDYINLFCFIGILFFSVEAFGVVKKFYTMLISIVSIINFKKIIKNVYEKGELKGSSDSDRERETAMFSEFTWSNFYSSVIFFIYYILFIVILYREFFIK